MSVFDEGEDVAGVLIDDDSSALETRLLDDDLISPGLAPILAAAGAHVAGTPGGDHGSLHRHDDVGKALSPEDLSQFEGGFSEESIQLAFTGLEPGC